MSTTVRILLTKHLVPDSLLLGCLPHLEMTHMG
nr:MAG TPA: hypothetical protein [Caudoviricetes sp.]